MFKMPISFTYMSTYPHKVAFSTLWLFWNQKRIVHPQLSIWPPPGGHIPLLVYPVIHTTKAFGTKTVCEIFVAGFQLFCKEISWVQGTCPFQEYLPCLGLDALIPDQSLKDMEQFLSIQTESKSMNAFENLTDNQSHTFHI